MSSCDIPLPRTCRTPILFLCRQATTVLSIAIIMQLAGLASLFYRSTYCCTEGLPKIPEMKAFSNKSQLLENQPNYLARKALKSAGVEEIPKSHLKSLPTEDELKDMFGKINEPVIFGKETCARYRERVPKSQRFVGAAGLYNTGTNALYLQMQQNLKLVGAIWQVPWGKHRPVESNRLKYTMPGMEKYNHSNVLPIVVVRDPFFWMQSMCRHPYSVSWTKDIAERCPNLVPSSTDQSRFLDLGGKEATFAVKVTYAKGNVVHWKSLVDFWSGWYRSYFVADFPRLMIRFEDLLLHGESVIGAIASCVGGDIKSTYYVRKESSKEHGSQANFLEVLLKTGNSTVRRQRLSKQDLEYSREALDSDLLNVFQYRIPHRAI